MRVPNKNLILDLAMEIGSMAGELEAAYKKIEQLQRAYNQQSADNACLKQLIQSSRRRWEVRG